ncbi:MAG: hypothetical protein AB7Q17_10565 [Phycisphaerae bacterium]
MPVPPDFLAFLRLLREKHVRYLLVGGYAVNFYGHSRRTDDLNVWIALHPENAARLADALVEFGFARESVAPRLFLTAGRIVRMGRAPLRLEILNEISGVRFDDCYDRRVVAEIGNVSVALIALPDLLANKQSAGRPKDLADVAAFAEATTARTARKPKRTRRKP